MLIGRAALELSRLGSGVGATNSTQTAIAQVAKSTLAEQRKALDAYAAHNDKDRWVAWLRGRALLAAGERKAGRAMIKAAAEGDDGLVVAMVDTADLLVDDGHRRGDHALRPRRGQGQGPSADRRRPPLGRAGRR